MRGGWYRIGLRIVIRLAARNVYRKTRMDIMASVCKQHCINFQDGIAHFWKLSVMYVVFFRRRS